MTLNEVLRKKLAEISETTGTTWAERIVDVWVREAVAGNLEALELIMDCLEDTDFPDDPQ